MQHASSLFVRSPLVAALILAAAAPAAAQIDLMEVDEIPQPNPQGGDMFGLAVSFDGATLAAGSERYGIGTTDDGEAYVWEWTAAGLGAMTTLQSPSGPGGGRFGSAVAVDGDTLVVGESHSSVSATQEGRAHVFVRQSGVWIHQTTLALANGGNFDWFGVSADLEGDRLVIGAPRHAGSGTAFVYERAGGAWTRTAQLVGSDSGSNDLFGSSVALFGDSVLVGAPMHGGSGVDAGAAYVFREAGGNWNEEQKLEPGTGTASGLFGWSVDIGADLALVGATRTNDPGAAYAFGRSGGTWSLEALLTAWSGTGFAMFGYSVALDGDRAVIGALQDTAATFAEGAAYVFDRDGGAWTGEARLVNAGAVANFLGSSSALSGETIFVGASSAPPSGAIYEFELRPNVGTNYCAAELNSTGQPGTMYANGSDLAADGELRLHAAQLPDNAFGYFLTGHGTGQVFPVAGSSGRLCLGGAPIGRYVNHILNTGPFGWFSVVVDTTQTPTPTGLVAIQAGETWNFQAWHRDAVGGQVTSNFTDAISITFQ